MITVLDDIEPLLEWKTFSDAAAMLRRPPATDKRWWP
jgi:hypothetical protein